MPTTTTTTGTTSGTTTGTAPASTGSVQITHLSVQIQIGTQNILLKSDGVPSMNDVKAVAAGAKDAATEAIKTTMQNGLAFRMDKDQEITVSVGSMFNWLQTKFNDTTGITVPAALQTITGSGALNDVQLTVRGFEISTKGDFAVEAKLTFNQGFYDSLGIPAAVTNIFRLDSLGIGLARVKQ